MRSGAPRCPAHRCSRVHDLHVRAIIRRGQLPRELSLDVRPEPSTTGAEGSEVRRHLRTVFPDIAAVSGRRRATCAHVSTSDVARAERHRRRPSICEPARSLSCRTSHVQRRWGHRPEGAAPEAGGSARSSPASTPTGRRPGLHSAPVDQGRQPCARRRRATATEIAPRGGRPAGRGPRGSGFSGDRDCVPGPSQHPRP